MRSLILVAFLVLSGAIDGSAQSTDITGWSNLRWGATKTDVLKSLQRFQPHDCSKPDSACPTVEATILLRDYDFSGVRFAVILSLGVKHGLAKVTMTAPDKREAFEKVLTLLTSRYGKPGLQAEYDGDEETTHTTWTWVKPHGTCALESDEGSGVFTVTYAAR